MQALKDDIDASQSDLEDVQAGGQQLMSLCGEPDRPEVQKTIDDADLNNELVNDQYVKRSKTLEEALSKAMTFQDELMVSSQNVVYSFNCVCFYGPV